MLGGSNSGFPNSDSAYLAPGQTWGPNSDEFSDEGLVDVGRYQCRGSARLEETSMGFHLTADAASVNVTVQLAAP